MADFKCNYCDYEHVNVSRNQYYLARLYCLNHVSNEHPEHEIGMGDGFTTWEDNGTISGKPGENR